MGNSCAKLSCHRGCNCFQRDHNAKQIVIPRVISMKWSWTYEHQLAFEASLCGIPTEITTIIQAFTYAANEEYSIPAVKHFHESYYQCYKRLLKKRLCSSWYKENASALFPFSIALLDETISGNPALLHLFKMDYLPALHSSHSYTLLGSSRRTLCVDNCTLTVSIQSVPFSRVQERTSKIYLIVLERTDLNSTNYCKILAKIERICSYIWSRTSSLRQCMVVQVTESEQPAKFAQSDSERLSMKNDIQRTVARKYNIPYIDVDFQSPSNIRDFFAFCVKYYWFLDAQ